MLKIRREKFVLFLQISQSHYFSMSPIIFCVFWIEMLGTVFQSLFYSRTIDIKFIAFEGKVSLKKNSFWNVMA